MPLGLLSKTGILRVILGGSWGLSKWVIIGLTGVSFWAIGFLSTLTKYPSKYRVIYKEKEMKLL